jgi:hypothetical protein
MLLIFGVDPSLFCKTMSSVAAFVYASPRDWHAQRLSPSAAEFTQSWCGECPATMIRLSTPTSYGCATKKMGKVVLHPTYLPCRSTFSPLSVAALKLRSKLSLTMDQPYLTSTT